MSGTVTVEKGSEFAAVDVVNRATESLISDAEKANENKPLDFGTEELNLKTEQRPKLGAEAKAEPEKKAGEEEPAKPAGEAAAEKKDQTAATDYMAQAIERAKAELKHKTDLNDQQITQYIAQRFLTAAKKIQREVEDKQRIDGERETYRKYHDAMESSPLVQALRAGKKLVIAKEEAEAEEEEVTPEGRQIKGLSQKIDAVIQAIGQREEKERQAGETRTQQERSRTMDQRIEQEEKTLSKSFPQFKAWIDYRVDTGFNTPEMEEVLETVERDGVSMTYAVKAYFADHGLPAIVKQTEKDTIARLQKKAGAKSEGSTVQQPTRKEPKYHDEGDVAQALVDELIGAGST